MNQKSRSLLSLTLILLYSSFLISPSLFYYLVQKVVTGYLPVFLIFQLLLITTPLTLFRIPVKAFLIITFPFFFLTLFQWSNYGLFRFELAEGAFLAIAATNTSEASEFLGLLSLQYWLLLFFSCGLYVWILVRKWEKFNHLKHTRKIVFALLIFCLLPKFIHTRKFNDVVETLKKSYPTRSLYSLFKTRELYLSYLKDVETVNKLKFSILKQKKDPNQTHIIIIGESARKHNHQFYGYSRQTNKYLSKIKNELIIFQDAYSASNSTIMSLKWILSKQKDNKTLVLPSVFKKAGYNCIWISNQGKFGEHLNATTALANTTEKTVFINNSDFGGVSYDERLLKYLDRYLKKPGQKFIILHLLGSHFHYKRRYPSSYDIFTKKKNPREHEKLSKWKLKFIDEYDNSILYTDFVISKIIEKVKKMNNVASVTYFSDHGELLFDINKEYTGHGGGKEPTSFELQVPFIIWTSPKFNAQKQKIMEKLKQISNSPISLIDFINLYLDFIGIEISNGTTTGPLDNDYSSNGKIYYYNIKGQKTIFKEIQ